MAAFKANVKRVEKGLGLYEDKENEISL